MIAGTPAYMSPQQAAGEDSSNTRADVYALGVILYRLMTGRTPHEMSGSSDEDLRRVVEAEPQRPRKINRRIHPEVEAIILKAIAKEPDRRYPSPGELAQDLQSHLSGDAVPARSRSTLYVTRKWVIKHRLRLALIITMCLLGAVALGYQQVLRLREAREAELRETELRGWAMAREGTAILADSRPGGALASLDGAKALIEKANPLAKIELDLIAWSRQQAAPPPLLTLAGHAGGTKAIVLLPDGHHAVSGGADGKLCHWHLPTGQLAGPSISADVQSVNALALSPDGKSLLSGGSDGVLKIWSLSPQPVLLDQLDAGKGHGAIRSVAIEPANPNGPPRALTAHDNGTVVLWDLEAKTPLREMPAHQTAATCVAFVPGGKYFVTLGQDQRMLRWSLTDKTPGSSMGYNVRAGCDQFAVAKDVTAGPLALSQTIGLATAMWSMETLKHHRGEPDPEFVPATAFAIAADAGEAVIGCENGTIKLFEFRVSPGVQRLYLAHTGPIRTLAFQNNKGPYRRLMLSGGDDGLIRVWDLGRMTSREARVWEDVGWVARQLSFSADGRVVLATGESGSQRLGPGRLIDVTTGRMIRAINQGDGVSGIDPNGNVVIYNAPVTVVPPAPPPPKALSRVDPNKPARTPGCLSAAADKAICVWPDGQSFQVLNATANATASGDTGRQIIVGTTVRSVCVSRDGLTVLAACEDGTVRTWSLETYLPLWTRKAHDGPVNAVAIADDGTWALSGGEDGKLIRWNLRQGTHEPLAYKRGPLSSVAIHPSGRLAAVASRADRTVQIWRVPPEAPTDASELVVLGSEGGVVSAVAFAPHQDRIVVVGCDLGAMRIWDISNAAEIARSAESLNITRSTPSDPLSLARWYRARRRSDWAAEVLQLARDRDQQAPNLLLAQCALDGPDDRAYATKSLSPERSAILLDLSGPATGAPYDAYFRESVGGPSGPPLIFRPPTTQPVWPTTAPTAMPDLQPSDRDLLAGAKLPEDWQRQADGVRAPNVETARLWLVEPASGDYALDVWFTRVAGDDAVGVTLAVGVVNGQRRHLEVVVGMLRNTLVGLRYLDGFNADANEFAIRTPVAIVNGVRQHLRVEVRTTGAKVVLNGVVVGQLNTYARLTPVPDAASDSGLGLLAKQSGVVFHAVRSSPLADGPPAQ